MSHFSFDNGAEDIVGGKDGILNGGVSFRTDSNRSYAVFNGVDSYISLGNDTFSSSDLAELTVSLWFNSDDLQGMAGHIIDPEGGAAPSIQIYQDRVWSGLWDGNHSYGDIGSVSPDYNNWVHFVITYSNGTRRIYKNGFQIYQNNQGGVTLDSFNREWTIGVDFAHQSFFKGAIDDLQIYNRALSLLEIQQLWSMKNDVAFESENFSLTSFFTDFGGGFRTSETHQLVTDSIGSMPNSMLSSGSYTLSTYYQPEATTGLTGGITIDAGSFQTNEQTIVLALNCNDPSGCEEVQISDNGLTWSNPQAYSTFTTWLLPENDGERRVYVRYKNHNGEWSNIYSDSIDLDITPPTVTLSPMGDTFMSAQAVTATASENATVYCTTDGIVPDENSPVFTSSLPLTVNGTVQCFAKDTAGNVGPVTSQEYEICTGSNMSISGVVTDATVDETMPIVTLTLNTGQTTYTDVNGIYSFGSLPRGYYTIDAITTATEGYVSYQKELKLCQDNIDHPVTLTKNSTTFGSQTSSGYSADSVNTATGNFVYEASDLAVPGRGIPFSFDRTYNSQDETEGNLGHGWTHNFNISLVEGGSGGNITLRWGDGKTEIWKSENGDYTPMYGVFSSLIPYGDGTFSVRRKDLIEYHFNVDHKLAAIVDENGNSILFSYTSGLMTEVTDSVGRKFQFSYDATGRIVRILDPIGRSTGYSYNADGDLISFTNLEGYTTEYGYDYEHKLLRITDPKGVNVITIVYDDQRKVVSSQRDAMGAEALYSYDTANKITQIVDPYGNTSYHHYDDLLRILKEVDAEGHSAVYLYNDKGNIDSVTDKNGNSTSFEYDEAGNILRKIEPLAKISSATFNSNNNPLTKTDPNGNVTTYRYYPVNDNLHEVEDSLGNITSYTYNPNGQIETKTDALGNTTSYEYDQYGNNLVIIDALGSRTTFIYDLVGRKTRENHSLGRAIAFEYDDMDRLIATTDALGSTSRYVYDENGNKTQHIDAKGMTTHFAYDVKDRLTGKTFPMGSREQYRYDLMDRRIEVQNAKGAVSSLRYDVRGNLLQEIDALGQTSRHEYDPNGKRTATTDPGGNKTTFSYDALNRLITTTDALGNTTTTAYDVNGNVLTVTDALGNIVTSSYDALGRLVTTTDPLGNSTTNSYDALGRLISVIDARSNAASFVYDGLGRMVEVTDTEGGVVSATYDALGNRLSLIDTRGNSTTYVYDVLNRLISETDPLGNGEIFTYDIDGNMLTSTNADGTASYNYDEENKLTVITQPDTTTVNYSYDETGKRTSIVDVMGTTSYSYNILDQLTSTTDVHGITIGYTYNSLGQRTSTRYPDHKRVTYGYDNMNRLVAVMDWTGVTTKYSYNSVGQRILTTMGNGTTVSYIYDTSRRLIQKTDRDPQGAVIASYTFTLDNFGNRTSVDMEQPTLPRLDYVDDTHSYNGGNQLLSEETTTYSFDGKGNRTNTSQEGVSRQYQYNFDNLLTRLEDGTNLYEYSYNSNGHRLAAFNNAEETRFLLDINGGMEYVLADMNNSNEISRYYIYGDGLLYSIDAITGKYLYHHYDSLGSTVAISDQTGQVVDSYAYLPYGKMTSNEAVTTNPFTFVGQYGVSREENGLYFMRARYYDPITKRFLSKDPIKGDVDESQRLSPYIYTEGNPVNTIDPNGLTSLSFAANQGWSTLGSSLNIRYDVGLSDQSFSQCDEYSCKYGPSAVYTSSVAKDPNEVEEPGVITGQHIIADEIFERENPIFGELSDSSGTCEFSFEESQFNTYTESQTTVDAGGLVANVSTISTGASELGNENTYNANSDTGKNQLSDKPKKHLNVARYAKSHYASEFAKLKSKNFANARTRSLIEMSIQRQLNSLQNAWGGRYSYRDSDRKREEKQRLRRDLTTSSSRFYAQLTSALSKHSVLIQNLDRMPYFNHGASGRGGVYAGN